MAVLAVDFDGVIMDPRPESRVKGYRMGPPLPGAVSSMQLWADAGHRLIVHTVRAATDTAHVEKWLRFFAIPFHEVTAIKPAADVYLDDQAVRFTDWEQAYAEVGSALG